MLREILKQNNAIRCIYGEIKKIVNVNFREFNELILKLRIFVYRDNLRSIIENSDINETWKENLIGLATKNNDRSQKLIMAFLQSDIKRIGKISEQTNNCLPICVCIVNDDLIRMKLFLNHYRSLGVKQFAILDDHSTDGTKEFLIKQPDVCLYETTEKYTTLLRSVWVSRIIADIGIDRWYLIVDSDELLIYKGYETIKLEEFVAKLNKRKILRTRGFMIDMFSCMGLYDSTVHTPQDIMEKYRFFSSAYSFDRFNISGGGRELLYDQCVRPLLTKYPLIYVKKGDVVYGAHSNFPMFRDYAAKTCVALLHYKFLPFDKEKYKRRVELGNMSGSSAEYKVYLEKDVSDKDYQKFIEKLHKYENFESLSVIPFLNKVKIFWGQD